MENDQKLMLRQNSASVALLEEKVFEVCRTVEQTNGKLASISFTDKFPSPSASTLPLMPISDEQDEFLCIDELTKNVEAKFYKNFLAITANQTNSSIQQCRRWCCIFGRDSQNLSYEIRNASRSTKKALILASIEIGFADGVSVIFDELCGCFEAELLSKCLRCFLELVTKVFPTIFDRNYRYRPAPTATIGKNDQVMGENLARIILILVGVNCEDDWVDCGVSERNWRLWSVLDALALVSVFSPKTAADLLDNQSIVNVISMYNDRHSTLICALGYCDYFRQFTNGHFLVARVVNFAILPLLRAGARCSYIYQTEWLTPLLVSHSIFADMAAEMLNGSKVNLKMFNLTPVLVEISSDDVCLLKQTVQQRFPRSLQAICRQRVLLSLPLGLTKRQCAVRMLKIPECLCSYLHFKEIGHLQ